MISGRVDAPVVKSPRLKPSHCLGLTKDCRGIFQCGLNRYVDSADAVKTLQLLDRDVGCQDRNFGGINVRLAQQVLDSHGALCLNLDRMAEFAGSQLQLLSRHVGMGDSSGTGSNSDNSHKKT